MEYITLYELENFCTQLAEFLVLTICFILGYIELRFFLNNKYQEIKNKGK